MEIREMHIAIVEDNPHDAFQLKQMLQDSQRNSYSPVFFQIQEYFSIEDAACDLAERSFDVILLDLMLPDSHGLDTLRRITGYVDKIPTILLTGLSDDRIAMEAVKLGAQDFLVKGQFNENMLLRSISYAMERHKLVRESKENEARLKSIYSQSPMGIALYEADGTLDFANDALLKSFGIDNIKKLRAYPLNDAPFIDADSLESIDREGSVKYEKRIDFCKLNTLSQNDCVNFYSVVIHKIQTEQAGFLVILQDITEQREVQNRLRAYNEKIKTELRFAARLQQSGRGAPHLRRPARVGAKGIARRRACVAPQQTGQRAARLADELHAAKQALVARHIGQVFRALVKGQQIDVIAPRRQFTRQVIWDQPVAVIQRKRRAARNKQDIHSVYCRNIKPDRQSTARIAPRNGRR